MSARLALQEIKRRDPCGARQWMRKWNIVEPPTEKELWNELIANSPPHGTMLFASQAEAHDALLAEMDTWLKATRGTPDYPSERLFCKTMFKLWTQHWRFFAPNR